MINVIIAEDDYRVAGIHEEFLAKLTGLHVVGKALTGKETLQLIRKKTVDLVLLDIYMPDKLGTNLIRDIRNVNPEVDIIMISAATDKQIVEDAIRSGVFDYIIKPVKMDRFMETIEKYKQTKRRLDASSEVDQSFLDDYFGHASLENPNVKKTPKGIDPLTLNKIQEILPKLNGGITAEEMGMEVGVSRTTARRYLEYLISIGTCTAELEYGIVGRPERRYHMASKTS
ncbi:response regulator [Virgibacillus dakarensis]|uniref:Response regulator n=1 Tax=Lentibacillus populi TaxID=1827502 RepID=A0A9W5TWB6_9BACI|nr:response regulator [Lentibacillus populi]MTW86831.1 response regulator [Virgibacillus dakarensis]GGB37054.1 response regulator [Lentibacillus populi]